MTASSKARTTKKKLSPNSTTKRSLKTPSLDAFSPQIVFQWVKTHNLKNIDIELPKNKLITITWVSGSGKSSLAFDTIYKEGQFRYIESLSSYLRQFFNLWARPDLEFCSGLSPAVAIEQNKRVGNSRSTVGTLTEIDDYLRLLFAKLWDSYCHGCGKEIKPQSIEQIMKIIRTQYNKKKIFLLKEITTFKNLDNLKIFVKKNRNRINKGKWFTRYLLVSQNDKTKKEKLDPIEYFYLEEPNIPEKYFPLMAFGIYDRVTIEAKKIPRLKEDIVKILSESPKFGVFDSEPGATKIQRFTDKIYCPNCNISYPELTPQHFSFNRQEWACPECHGIWEVLQADLDKIINPEASLKNAILPWRDSRYGQAVLSKVAAKYEIDIDKIRKTLPERFQHVVLHGDSELLRVNMWAGRYVSLRYEGIEAILKEQYHKWLLTVDFQAMLDMKSCHTCNWAKLRKESLYSFLTIDLKNLPKASQRRKFQNFVDTSTSQKLWDYATLVKDKKLKLNITDLHYMTLKELTEFVQLFVKSTPQDKILVDRITHPLLDRASTIWELGLGYITLYRQMWTLSWWEIQRLRLAKQLGNKLTGIIYVLDEPTIGLSEKEIQKAITAIQKLRDMWNTVIVVEHNESFIKASDRIVEIWAGAGDFGGEVMFSGTYQKFLKSDCLTAQYLTGKKKVKVNFSHKPSNQKIKIHKASKYNLQDIDVEINLWSFTIITGPSGAGKTTLMYNTLYKFLNEKDKFTQSFIRFNLLKKGRDWDKIITAPVMNKKEYEHYQNLSMYEFHKELWVETIRWHDEVKNLIYVDQSSIGKTPRSCPATFIGLFDRIRALYAGSKQAKYLWFTSGHFSFNSAKWACPACKWYGYKKIELQFLPDTYVPCDLCKGHRYKSEILEITRHGKNIAQILEMYVYDALDFFQDMGIIHEQLQLMMDIGLGYLRMWQPAHTLSGWESQRIKLVKHLLKSYTGHSVYFLDEPTVGLHFADIEKLLLVLKRFLDNWDTILMIEHDQNILQFADKVIELDDGKIVKK